MSEQHDDREDHGRRAHDGRSNQHRLRSGFERVAGTVVLFQQFFGPRKVWLETMIPLNLGLSSRNLLDG